MSLPAGMEQQDGEQQDVEQLGVEQQGTEWFRARGEEALGY
jgi:hypothetical protein